eukprot:COSAG02_NODE_1736_length_11157_cov_3.509586_4_plen_100_part_00
MHGTWQSRTRWSRRGCAAAAAAAAAAGAGGGGEGAGGRAVRYRVVTGAAVAADAVPAAVWRRGEARARRCSLGRDAAAEPVADGAAGSDADRCGHSAEV